MVTAVIPVYNEEELIGRAVSALRASPLISEIVVVDDGSGDRTAERAKELGVLVITLPRNTGKGNAMDVGVINSRNDIILFCDGDMYGFSKDGVESVLKPMLNGDLEMSIAIRPFIRFARIFFPFLIQTSGFRAVTKQSWKQVPKDLISGYQVELMLNFVARRNNWRVGYVCVPGLKHTVKEIKYGLLAGLKARGVMIRDVSSLFVKVYVRERKLKRSSISGSVIE
ncbi:MAG: glycosyltransferase family 2 protein [bacterium]|nr:glycosyltransferase family 2 protein [bacterium]